jgi:hypothetical protein
MLPMKSFFPRLAFATALLATLPVGSAWAQHQQHGGGQGKGAGGGGGHGGHSGGHAGHHAPGTVQPMCHGTQGDMPPHYCEPEFKAVSSVAGVRVASAEVISEKSLRVTLESTLGANPRMVLVGGTGALAGGAVVAAGWKNGAEVRLELQGQDSLYAHRAMHLHVFPLTDK